MRSRAIADLVLLAAVFWGVWALRFAGVENIGLWTMLAGVSAGAVLLISRKEGHRSIGLQSGGGLGWTLARAGEAALLTLIVGGVGISVATALGFPPSTPSAITNQPEALAAFLLDILVGVWIGAAFGEEIFFRGMLLQKFRALFGGGRVALFLALSAQGVWFGAGHASQGISGMVVTGAIGFTLAVFFVTRAKGSLFPLILGHGLVNTISQTISYLS